MSDLVKVDVFSTDTSNPILNQIRKTGQTFFISDVSDKSTFRLNNDDFIDISEIYGAKHEQVINKYIEKGTLQVLYKK